MKESEHITFRSILIFALLTSLTCSCSREKEALITFSEKHSCPEDKIQVTPASGESYAKRYAAAYPQVPPAEIASDPARVAVWKKNHGADYEWANAYEIFNVKGCKNAEELACTCPGLFSNTKCTGCRTPQDMCTCRTVERPSGQ